MIDNVNKAIGMIVEEFKKEFGEDAKIEDGYTLTAVFNDGIMTLEFENGEIKANVFVGKPYIIDFNLGILGGIEI